ncbi:MAG: enoyl-CoA hydratase/isomerase family protein [Proteobacteria bacterium]|nr:enoyl-CoA hydratase/isomerase family protein [Pseudomonadota bacterium]
MANFETLKFERDGAVAIITLNRPDAANSLNVKMSEELVKVATHCDSNPDIRCVVFTGAGKMFSAGGDLVSFAAQGDSMGEYMRYATTGLHAAISRFTRMNAPFLVAVNGGGWRRFQHGHHRRHDLRGRIGPFTMAYARAGVSPDGSELFPAAPGRPRQGHAAHPHERPVEWRAKPRNGVGQRSGGR